MARKCDLILKFKNLIEKEKREESETMMGRKNTLLIGSPILYWAHGFVILLNKQRLKHHYALDTCNSNSKQTGKTNLSVLVSVGFIIPLFFFGRGPWNC